VIIGIKTTLKTNLNQVFLPKNLNPMKNLILISTILFAFSCSKTPTSTPTATASGTFTFNGVTYTPLHKLAAQNGSNYSIILGYTQTSGTITENCTISLNFNKDSTYIVNLSQTISGVSNLYFHNAKTGKRDSRGYDIILFEYKKNPNIVKNTNGTFTINDSFKCFKLNATSIDTTRYTLYVNNVTTQ